MICKILWSYRIGDIKRYVKGKTDLFDLWWWKYQINNKIKSIRRDKNLIKTGVFFKDLTGANLKYMDLHDEEFYEVDFTDADLYHSNLCGADFTKAILHDANLEHADTRGANFRDANLHFVRHTFQSEIVKELNRQQLNREEATADALNRREMDKIDDGDFDFD